VSVTIQVPESGPLFEGHFPGRPILPGVALLAMICHAIAPGATLRGIRFVRFRELVLPGQVVDVVATSGADGATRFETRRDGAKVANGSVVFGDPTAEADEGFSVAARPVRDVPPLDELLPHRKPMRVVEAVLGEADDGATCLARISDRCGLSAGGEAPALASIEAAAQTAAVWEALRRRREGATSGGRLGYLVSIHDMVLCRRFIAVDAEQVASVRLAAASPPLTQYHVEVVTEGTVALRGTIGTWLGD
jgi:predicted hotdog family 3-hydroxylacyl-ACP dehydratase